MKSGGGVTAGASHKKVEEEFRTPFNFSIPTYCIGNGRASNISMGFGMLNLKLPPCSPSNTTFLALKYAMHPIYFQNITER